MKKNYSRIGVDTDDDIPLNKPLKFPTLAIVIRCFLQNGETLYPQIYSDESLYDYYHNYYDFLSFDLV